MHLCIIWAYQNVQQTFLTAKISVNITIGILSVKILGGIKWLLLYFEWFKLSYHHISSLSKKNRHEKSHNFQCPYSSCQVSMVWQPDNYSKRSLTFLRSTYSVPAHKSEFRPTREGKKWTKISFRNFSWFCNWLVMKSMEINSLGSLGRYRLQKV